MTDCETCKYAKWSFDRVQMEGHTKAHRWWYVSGCKIDAEPITCDCEEYERKDIDD